MTAFPRYWLEWVTTSARSPQTAVVARAIANRMRPWGVADVVPAEVAADASMTSEEVLDVLHDLTDRWFLVRGGTDAAASTVIRLIAELPPRRDDSANN